MSKHQFSSLYPLPVGCTYYPSPAQGDGSNEDYSPLNIHLWMMRESKHQSSFQPRETQGSDLMKTDQFSCRMALRGFADVISEEGITEIVTVSSLASALHFALGPTEGNGMSPPSSSAYLCDCI